MLVGEFVNVDAYNMGYIAMVSLLAVAQMRT
jgi:hypothetical protein